MNVPASVFFRSYVIWSAACVATGWGLSLCHALTRAGYAVILPLVLAGLAWLLKEEMPKMPCVHRRGLWVFIKRFHRPLPLIFLSVVAIALIGGTIYAPNNFDALTYRLTRMLNWQASGQWFWIPTFNGRMNFSGAGWEWIAMPFMVLTHSDRGMFLINALGFALMPGLLFSIFRQLGVARRAAWTWMWLLPLAYGFATQAGSIGNDLTGTLLILLSVHFALRARHSGCASDVGCALLAAALLTGVKLSNLPLALPCLVAVWPALGQLRKNLTGSLVVAALAIVISAVPIMVLNYLNTDGWGGDPQNKYNMQVKNPLAAFCGNAFLLAEQSLAPPVLPFSAKINQGLLDALPGSLKEQYPRLTGTKINELPGEEGAGLGLGVTLPLLIVLGASIGKFKRNGSNLKFRLLPPVVLAAWIATLFYLAKIGSEAGPRLLLPYYPLAIIPLLLLPAQQSLLRLRSWRIFLGLLALMVLPVLILSVSRPLWPAQSISKRLAAARPENKLLQRLATTYDTYARRNDVLAPLRHGLPDEALEIGFIAGSNDTDYSLWRPFGQRKVKYLRHDSYHFLQAPEQTEWVVVKQNIWPEISPIPLPEWAQAHHAKITLVQPVTALVSWGAENWCLLYFEKASGPAAAASH
jgi:hypothetical protein